MSTPFRSRSRHAVIVNQQQRRRTLQYWQMLQSREAKAIPVNRNEVKPIVKEIDNV